ncbi:MAG: undecaprenyl-diphosphate phosphatase [Patescibacteria group bacterium]
MLEAIILGTIQGIAEWLPVSSEGLIFIVKTNFFNSGESIKEITELALWLHLGTFLAALIYFRSKVITLFKALFNYQKAGNDLKKTLIFLIITTIISGVLGITLLVLIDRLGLALGYSTKIITLIIGLLLLLTGIMQLKAKAEGKRKEVDLKTSDSILLGIMQGFAALPGLSRSGLTISALLLKNFNKTTALTLSFLMSLPIVLAGNIILNFDKFSFNPELLTGLLFSFIFGYLTIGIMLKIAKKINFGWFVLGFGVLTIIAIII